MTNPLCLLINRNRQRAWCDFIELFSDSGIGKEYSQEYRLNLHAAGCRLQMHLEAPAAAAGRHGAGAISRSSM